MRRAPVSAFGPAWLQRRLQGLLPDYPAVSLCIAYSGGVDSTALLGALAALRGPPRALRAIHIDHGLQPQSRDWASHCRRVARQLGVPIVVRRAQIARPRGRSLEAQARVARYELFAEVLRPGEVLLTAHHADDQLETVMLQLLRGAGVAGMAAMPECIASETGRLLRPLLSCSRAQLVDWTRRRRLAWIEDLSNRDEAFDRNYLRARVLPLLRERWPAAAAAVLRSARHAAEARRLLDALARADVARAADGPDLRVSAVRVLDADRRRNALRYWIAKRGHRVPDSRRLEEIAGPLLAARADSNPRVCWPAEALATHSVLERQAGRLLLYVQSKSAPTHAREPMPLSWNPHRSGRLALPWAGGSLELRDDAHGSIDRDALPARLTVGLRRGGEHLHTQAGAARSLKKLLQNAGVAPGERARMPLIYAGARLLAVGDRWIDRSIAARRGTARRASLRWRRA